MCYGMKGRALLALTLMVGAAVVPAGVAGAGRGAGATDDKDALDWGGCDGDDELPGEALDGAQCARLEVPVDYADPKGDRIRLGVLRVPAGGADDERIGALLVNPGGPGATAREFANRIGHLLPDAILRRFDVIGVDPRGAGASEVDCGYDEADLFGADPVVESEEEAAALVAVNQEYVAACDDEAGDLLPHLGTRDAARDLDAVRAALGDRQISFLGFSYGTVLGQTYAQLFPERVRAMVLDGAVPLGPAGVDLAYGQAVGFERALAAFAQNCNAQPDCPASPDALGAVTELMMRTQQAPVPAEPRDLGVGELETGLALPLYDQSMWHDLATAVEAALLGNGTRLVRLADEYIDEGNVDLYYAVNCIDFAWPTGPDGPGQLLAAGAAAEVDAPRFGDSITNQYLPCTMWPVPAEPLTPAGPLPPSAAATLVVATTGDPATPFQGGVDLAGQLGGVLLAHEGEGHTIVGQGLDCIDGAVAHYLVDLELPAPGTTCASPPPDTPDDSDYRPAG
jgi:pimeloyl-ACP methyl ester carboxylesterase